MNEQRKQELRDNHDKHMKKRMIMDGMYFSTDVEYWLNVLEEELQKRDKYIIGELQQRYDQIEFVLKDTDPMNPLYSAYQKKMYAYKEAIEIIKAK